MKMSSEEAKVEEAVATTTTTTTTTTTPTNSKALDGEKAMQPMKEALQAAVGNCGTPPASPTRSRPGSARSPLADQFRAYAKFGDSKADGKVISLSQSDKWMKQAKVIDGKKITSTDTGIYFKKLKLVIILSFGTISYLKYDLPSVIRLSFTFVVSIILIHHS